MAGGLSFRLVRDRRSPGAHCPRPGSRGTRSASWPAAGVTVGHHVLPGRLALLGDTRGGLLLQNVQRLLEFDCSQLASLDAQAMRHQIRHPKSRLGPRRHRRPIRHRPRSRAPGRLRCRAHTGPSRTPGVAGSMTRGAAIPATSTVPRSRYAVERRQLIVQTVRGQGRVDAAAMAEQLQVSTETIRKDLLQLERSGLLRRVHGGAVAIEDLSFEPAVSMRRSNQEARLPAQRHPGGGRQLAGQRDHCGPVHLADPPRPPRPGRSASPSSPRTANRRRHLRAVSWLMPRSRAIRALPRPRAAVSTICARSRFRQGARWPARQEPGCAAVKARVASVLYRRARFGRTHLPHGLPGGRFAR